MMHAAPCLTPHSTHPLTRKRITFQPWPQPRACPTTCEYANQLWLIITDWRGCKMSVSTWILQRQANKFFAWKSDRANKHAVEARGPNSKPQAPLNIGALVVTLFWASWSKVVLECLLPLLDAGKGIESQQIARPTNHSTSGLLDQQTARPTNRRASGLLDQQAT